MNTSLDPVILIAEDDPDDAMLLKDAFAEIDENRLAFVANGKILIDHLAQLANLPKIIVIDLNMPVIDGRSVIKILRGDIRTVEIPLIVLSTIKNKEDIDQVMALGASDFFTKPSTFQDLINITKTITKKWLL